MQLNIALSLLLLSSSMLFWAWQIDVLWLGAGLVCLLLPVVGLGKRWAIDRSSCHHIGDLCVLIALGIFAFYWVDSKASQAIFPTLRLLPIALFPLLFLQYIHAKQAVPRSALLMMQRKSEAVVWVDIAPLFVVLCVFSAGASKAPNMGYFVGLLCLLLALLLAQRFQAGLKRYRGVALMLMGVIALAFAGQLGLVALQQKVESSMNQWLMNQHGNTQTSTAIGHVGQLKLSDAILFRVQALANIRIPLLLQTASYQRYMHGQWFVGGWQTQRIALDGQSWLLRQAEGKGVTLRFLQSFEQQAATLALPLHAYAVQKLAAHSMNIQQGGSVVVQAAQPFASYEVLMAEQGDILPPAKHGDLHIPKHEAAAVARVAKALNLYQIKQDKGEKAVLDTLNSYFWRDYTYSMWLQGSAGAASPLADFLLNTHSGHCEYFATATVMLLREVGIAARYAVGYAMQEQDEDSGLYVIRGRDAHAWALAFVDGAWQNVDNTPPDWFALEDEDRDAIQDFKDAWSALVLMIQQWRYAESEDNTGLWLLLLLVLFSFLAWRILRRVQVSSAEKGESAEHGAYQAPSDWLLLEQALIDAGFARFTGETLHTWLIRVDKRDVLPLVALYYQQRFDSAGLNAVQQQHLSEKSLRYRQDLDEAAGEDSNTHCSK